MVEIRPGCARDLCFVAANLRDEDIREIFASAVLESATQAAMLSWLSSGPEWCWTAWLDDQPQAAFGLSSVGALQPHILSAWAWGTPRFKRCIPAMTRFIKAEWPQMVLSVGVTRVEARSLRDHDLAHKWLSGLGARKECELPEFGVNRETFELWAFLKRDFDNVLLDENAGRS